MSGTVVVEGRRQPVCRRHRPRRPAGHRGQRLVALRHLDEGHRHRRARQYRPHVGLHGAVGQPRGARRCRRGAGRFASTRRGCSCAAAVKSLGADCIEKEMRPEHLELLAGPARAGRRRPTSSRKSSRATARPARSTISTSTTPTRIEADSMTYKNPPTTPRKSATFDDYTLSEIRRAAATGIYDIRGGGAKRKLPHFDDLLFLGASISRYPLEGYRERCDTSVVLGARYRQEADRAEDPDHHRRHELRLAVRPGQGSARPRRHARRHLDHHRRRRHDRGGARPFARRWSTSTCRRATA